MKILGTAKAKIAAGVIASLLIVMAIMAWQLRSEIRHGAALLESKQRITEANQENVKTINRLEAERDHLEFVLEQRAEAQMEIEAKARQREQQLQTRLQKLRGKYETVDDWLNMPVPSEFVDYWMRQERTAGSNGNESD